MPEEPPPPDPNLIYSLYLGVYKPQALRIALLLDLFSPLADGFFSLVMGAGSGGALNSFAEYQGWLARAGLERIKQVGETWTPARRGEARDERRGNG